MIFYFSATSNCKYVANKIAKELDDQAQSIEDYLKRDNKVIELQSHSRIGFVTPTYRFCIPTILEEFLNDFIFLSKEDCYFFSVSTYGTTCGCANEQIRKILLSKNKIVNGSYSVKMPDNWTPDNDMTKKDAIKVLCHKADVEINSIIKDIRDKRKTKNAKGSLPYLFFKLGKAWYNNTRKTNNYYVLDNCTGCSLCAKSCPVKAIEIKDNKPVWVKDRCVMCARCLHHCPTFSIQIKNSKTIKHGQYDHKMYE